MLKYFTKFAMEIVPSVIATILGAYIVNHYINAKPAADPAVVSSTESKKIDAKVDPRTDSKTEVKPAEAMTDVANVPEPGVKSKGVAEKAIPGKPAEGVSEKPADTPAAAVEPRRIPLTRDKAVAKTAPAAAPAPQPVETAAVPEEHRDAAELARAAIERLRAGSGSSAAARPQETVRVTEPPRVQEAPRSVVAVPPAIAPLPPPITVAVPAAGTPGASGPANPPYTSSIRVDDDPLRPTPPADIPTAPPSRPLDLHADGKTVAEDMLSAAKSMFHAVLPK